VALRPGERTRVRLLFFSMGTVPVFLACWLAHIQVFQKGQLSRGPDRPPLRLGAAAVDAQSDVTVKLPAPRGTILDRHGAVMAIDCDTYEVRAEVRVPPKEREDAGRFHGFLGTLAVDLADALVRDPAGQERSQLRERHQTAIAERLVRAFKTADLPRSGALPKGAVPSRANVLVCTDVDALANITALRAVDAARSHLTLDLQLKHKRVYPDREYTWGIVGFEMTVEVPGPRGPKDRSYVRWGATGMERLRVLLPGESGARTVMQDVGQRYYWTGPAELPSPAAMLHTTVDLELQRAACRELDRQAATRAATGKVTLPQWGSLLLVDVQTGDVLAMASFHRDEPNPKLAQVAPYQALYEPGSIVKPLVFAWALQKGGLDWNESIDCTSSGQHHERVVEETGRRVRDDHAVGVVSPHWALVNSSNIGAVKVGAKLSKDQWQDWFRYHGFGRSLDLGLVHEQVGGHHKDIFAPKPETQFRRWSLSSFSQGYELQVNAMQVARAYLSMLRGRQSDLKLYRSVDLGDSAVAPVDTDNRPRELDPSTIEAVTAALTDVLSADEGATGRFVRDRFEKEEGIELHGLVAGKTGTAVSSTVVKGKGKLEVRNASFVGFAPANNPRYLAVCVLQKEGNARFYGGSYAAPPAIRLLLHALRMEEQRRLRQEPQVSVAPGEQAGAEGLQNEGRQGGDD